MSSMRELLFAVDERVGMFVVVVVCLHRRCVTVQLVCLRQVLYPIHPAQ